MTAQYIHSISSLTSKKKRYYFKNFQNFMLRKWWAWSSTLWLLEVFLPAASLWFQLYFFYYFFSGTPRQITFPLVVEAGSNCCNVVRRADTTTSYECSYSSAFSHIQMTQPLATSVVIVRPSAIFKCCITRDFNGLGNVKLPRCHSIQTPN